MGMYLTFCIARVKYIVDLHCLISDGAIQNQYSEHLVPLHSSCHQPHQPLRHPPLRLRRPSSWLWPPLRSPWNASLATTAHPTSLGSSEMVVPRQSAPGMVRMEAVRVHRGNRGWHGCRDEEKGECNEPCDDLGEERVGHEEEALG
jgi:hypothetical protein